MNNIGILKYTIQKILYRDGLGYMHSFSHCFYSHIFENLTKVDTKLHGIMFTFIDRGVGNYREFSEFISKFYPNLKILIFQQNYGDSSVENLVYFLKNNKCSLLICDNNSPIFDFYNYGDKENPYSINANLPQTLYKILNATFKSTTIVTGNVINLDCNSKLTDIWYNPNWTSRSNKKIFPKKLKQAMSKFNLNIVHYEEAMVFNGNSYNRCTIKIKRTWCELYNIFGGYFPDEIIEHIINRIPRHYLNIRIYRDDHTDDYGQLGYDEIYDEIHSDKK